MHITDRIEEGNSQERSDFAAIYLAYFPKMLRFARAYLVSKEDAENVVQDLFIHLWENPQLLSSCRSPQAFLFTLVRRRSIDYLRRKLQEAGRAGSLDELENQEYRYKLYSLETFDEAGFTDETLGQLLQTAVDTLPEQCRRIFVESRMNHKRNKEIARELGLSVQTVKNQLGIAVRKLRNELKDYLPLLVFLLS